MPQRIRVKCPKCLSEGAWYEQDFQQDVWLRCLCGYAKVVETKSGGMTITHADARDNVTLPRRDSKLYECLAALIGLRLATTGSITEHVNEGKRNPHRVSSSDIASQLTVLRYKGLAEVPDGMERKGAPGGSTWRPTDVALRLLAKEC